VDNRGRHNGTGIQRGTTNKRIVKIATTNTAPSRPTAASSEHPERILASQPQSTKLSGLSAGGILPPFAGEVLPADGEGKAGFFYF
jgi:hypothetical protein